MALKTVLTLTSSKHTETIIMNPVNRAIFELHLQGAYTDLFANDPEYAYSAARCRPSELARKMTLGLCKGEANKDGEGIKRACKAVGIKHTYKAISAYLNALESVAA